jgi:5'-3' exonuclease
MWDGFEAGKLRYEIYPPYKSNRNKEWNRINHAIATDGLESFEDKEEYELFKQRTIIKNYLEELCVRQLEVDYIEADDLIAQYILLSVGDNEEIVIFSRDRDYLQLISDKVGVITPDSSFILNRSEYEQRNGHTLDNELLFKCFEGDDSDKIEGVKGVSRNTLIKYFPNIAREKYTYSKLVEESYEAMKKKKLKIYDKIIGAESVLYRNARLMNLRKPFLNKEAVDMVDIVKGGILDHDRNIDKAVEKFIAEGMIIHAFDQSVEMFFSPFYRLLTKEREYAQRMKI